jgi:hypothetical protein
MAYGLWLMAYGLWLMAYGAREGSRKLQILVSCIGSLFIHQQLILPLRTPLRLFADTQTHWSRVGLLDSHGIHDTIFQQLSPQLRIRT